MKSSLWQWLDLWARRTLPAGLSLSFVLLAVLPVPVPGFSSIVPMLALASVFFWAVHQPKLLPPVIVFVIGLVQDILSGTPMGAGTAVLLIAYGLTVSQRRFFYNRSFVQVWAGFALVALLAGVLSWFLTVLVGGGFMPPRAVAFQFFMTVTVYPVVTWALHGAQRLVLTET